MLLQLRDFDLSFNSKCLVGVDEAGRGSLIGPVFAAACLFNEEIFIEGINDSKKLSKKKRESIYEKIINSNAIYSVASINSDVIDKVNIYKATKLAMIEAINLLPFDNDIELSKFGLPDVILVDGMDLLDQGVKNSRKIIKGDSKSLSIAAASIIAKVERDKLMDKMHEEFPEYNFKSNKGYGTKAHFEAIYKYGPTIYHRKSFDPVKSILEN